MGLLYGRTGRLTAKNGIFRPGQTAPLPSHLAQQGGMRLIMGGGDGNPGCSPAGRILQYDMVCDKGGAAGAAPNSTVFIYDTPGRKVDPIAHCTYVVEWHRPAACPSKAG